MVNDDDDDDDDVPVKCTSKNGSQSGAQFGVSVVQSQFLGP